MDLGLALSPQQKQLAVAHARERHWIALQVPGINSTALRGRLQALINEHEALRLRYERPQGATGLRQRVCDEALLEWHDVPGADLDAVQRQALTDERAWGEGALSAWWQGEWLLLAAPVCSLDLRSLCALRGLLTGEAVPPEEAPMQYSQYADWINELQRDEDAEQGAQFWRNLNLAQAPGLRLIERYGVPSGQSQQVTLALPPSAAANLQALVARENLDESALLLAAWASLLARLNGQAVAQLVLQHDARDDYEELAGALGVFEQSLPMVLRLSTESSWLSVARQLARQRDNALAWQEHVSQPSVQPDWRAGLQAGLRLSHQARPEASRPLSWRSALELLLHVTLDERGQGQLVLAFDGGLYREPQMARLLARFTLWLEQLLVASERPLEELLPLLVDDGLPLCGDADPVEDIDLIAALRRHARQHPQRPALRDGGWQLSYAELDALSDRVASQLRRAGAGPKQIVGLYLPRSGHSLVAMLACFKAGAAYLPLDPQQPPLRLAAILDSAKPCVLLHLDELPPPDSVPGLPWSKASDGPRLGDDEDAPAGQLAYVLYTSGSSGTPKGVQVEHGQLRHYSNQIATALQLPEAGHYGLVSSLQADLGNTVLFPAWLRGGCVHLLAQDVVTDARAFADELARHPLDVLKIVPSHLEALIGQGPVQAVLPREVLVLGGEAISDRLATALASDAVQCRVYNHYGPTETTVGVLWRAFDPASGSLGSALNRVIGDNRIDLLDAAGRPVPDGQAGEVYISGRNVARGYLGIEQSEAFGAAPASDQRRYRTGDLALRQADGALRLLGRNDQQVKIRGFRLELSEVEAALLAQPGVEHAAVLLDGAGEQARLLGFIVEDPAQGMAADERRSELSRRLPDYMLPSALLALKALPLNANGKLDRQALLSRARQALQRQHVAPANALERAVLDIWCEVLGSEEVGVTDNFFSSGGHSLAAIRVVSLMRERLGLNPPTNLLFERQTVRVLVEGLEQNGRAPCHCLNAGTDSGPVLLLVHGAQGHLQAYQPLLNALGEQASVYGLQAPEQGWDSLESLTPVLDEYAGSVPAFLKGRPLLVLGWSLASRLALMLLPHLQAQGFTVQTLWAVDHDPQRSLDGGEDESGQLLADLAFFCRSRGVEPETADWQLMTAAVRGLAYKEALLRLVAVPQASALLGEPAGDSQVLERVMRYRDIRSRLYRQALPRTDVPLVLWRGRDHADLAASWQALAPVLQQYSVDAGHHQMLEQPGLAQALRGALGLSTERIAIEGSSTS
ncbi:amino acid adenylation domain-containing protein [Pseudomonas putida]|uniref:amino acid adenylation domain-containing protein n=1 Tax=Pseudomonas putida TaxID=303 RepID=UPI002DB61EF3|nr:amino acid adenylation domain-containing protein [Pseudomonas putida]WRW06758.1 amino acid adenylation domain-containing protein [Pseudomonas putida]